jgi:hypothetical protein
MARKLQRTIKTMGGFSLNALSIAEEPAIKNGRLGVVAGYRKRWSHLTHSFAHWCEATIKGGKTALR